MGRPTSLTDDIVLRLVDSLERGNSIKISCALAGIHVDTYYGWMERAKRGEEPYSEFSDFCAHARAVAQSRRVSNIEAAGPKDWRASAWLLERSDPEDWGERKHVSATVTTSPANAEQVNVTLFPRPTIQADV